MSNILTQLPGTNLKLNAAHPSDPFKMKFQTLASLILVAATSIEGIAVPSTNGVEARADDSAATGYTFTRLDKNNAVSQTSTYHPCFQTSMLTSPPGPPRCRPPNRSLRTCARLLPSRVQTSSPRARCTGESLQPSHYLNYFC